MQPYHAPRGDVLYMLDAKRFNLTALLQSGQYYLDETGLLVAPNGTRYRIPSGPPEGRKPLRPDRPNSAGHVNINQPGDVHSPVQQDSSKYVNSKMQYGLPPSGTNYDQYNKTLFSYPKLQSLKSTPPPIPLLDTTTQAIELSTYVDWNVILLAVILSSISLACNLGLIVLLSWKPCCPNLSIKTADTTSKEKKIMRKHSKRGPVFSEPSVMCSCTVDYTPQELNTSYHLVNTAQCSTAVWFEPSTECKTVDESPLRQAQRLGNQRNYGQCPGSYRDSIHNRIAPKFNRSTAVNGKALNSTPSRRAEKSDQGSSSGGSWKMVLSDGIVSDTTYDEESTEDSGNNSDAPFRTRGSYWKQNIPQTHLPNRSKYYSDRKSTNTTIKDSILKHKPPECLHRIRDSTHEQLTPIRSNCTTHSSCDEESSQSATIPETNTMCSDLCANSIYVWHTLGIHIGILGVVLSIIQLFTLCSALSCRMKLISPEREPKATLLSEIVCVLSTSLAADTILCARQYLISALLIVYWSTLSFSILYRLNETSKISNVLVSLCMSDKQTDFPSTLVHTGKPSARPKRQQRHRPSVSYVNRGILLHLLVDPWLVACLLRLLSRHLNVSTVTVTTKQSTVALRDRSVSQYSEMAQSISVDSSGANASDPRFGLGLPSKQRQSASSASPVRLSCLPIARRMDSPVNINKPSLTSAHVFMSCFPNSNLLVSPLAMPNMEASTVMETLGKPRLLVPNTSSKLNVQTLDSIGGSVGMPSLVTSYLGTKEMSGFTFRPNGNLNPVKYDATKELGSCHTHCQDTPITDVYPKLCPHHQQLLEQHIQPTPLQMATKFGSVPRLFAQRSKQHDSSTRYQTKQTVSQSTATAAVMAAAAAAVAAQTGTMNRSSIEMDGSVQLSTINSVHPLGGSYTYSGSQYNPKHATSTLNTNQPVVK
ncbi:hypothetical protein AHF37_07074 [Paragonimus kellicotti]|nr:hypothetical protein AHF37_07074 [Paragonimus kellicotti]